MKHKLLLLLAILLSAIIANAQKSQPLSITASYTYYAIDKDKQQLAVLDFVKQQNIIVLKLRDSKKNLKITLVLNTKQYSAFVQESNKWGVVAERTIAAENAIEQVEELDMELDFLSQKAKQYKQLLDTVPVNHKGYLKLWREARNIEDQHQDLLYKKRNKQQQHKQYIVKLTIVEEQNSMHEQNYSWVNMPGVEYAFMRIETPKEGFNTSDYHGMFLKYMFTRGKSYLLFGAFKDISGSVSEVQIDEMFLFAVGTDFYSRYLGGGKRKMFNLYSSFNGGYFLATSETTKFGSGYISAFIGMELLKTKFIIIDNKAGYFMPFEHNRNMRGFSYRVSVNFMF